MNINLASIVAFSAGVTLIYSAVKNQDPRDVIRKALGSDVKTMRPISTTTGTGSVGDIPNYNPTPGTQTVSV